MQTLRLPPPRLSDYLLDTRSNMFLASETKGRSMDSNTLDASMKGIKSIWGPLSTEVVAGCRKHLEDLVKARVTEEW